MNANAEIPLPGAWEHDHGERCDCLLLAAAAGAGPSAVNFSFCRRVLQKRWKMKCEHGRRVPGERVTPEMPPHDSHDAVQAILVANARSSSG